jgi:hypothetical protein
MSDDDGIGVFHRHNAIVYWLIGGAALVLVVVGLIAYRGAKQDQAANQKADQFISQLRAAGVQRVPSTDQVARVLGTDGGSTCQDPGNALRRSTLFGMLTNGAGGPGIRPVIADTNLIRRGQLLIIQTYCPDQLDSIKSWFDDLRHGDVVRN